MLWLLTVVTTLVLLAIGMFVKDIARTPAVAAPAALSSSARSPGPAAAGSGRHRVSPKHKASPPASVSVSGPRVTDAASGLSFSLLSSPWLSGCPSILNTTAFAWTAGEHAVAGPVTIGGSTFDWHGNACSGQLQPQFPYAGTADLQETATQLVSALDPAYYTGLTHDRTIESSSPTQVSGHPAWTIGFLITYPDAASEGLGWSSEPAAVVVVDRGAGLAPGVFYVSVPANLGTGDVTALLASLRLSPP